MNKFKIGDIVKVIDESDGWVGVKKGDIGKVCNITKNKLYVDFDNYTNWAGEFYCFVLAKKLPKIKKIKEKTIIIKRSVIIQIEELRIKRTKEFFDQGGENLASNNYDDADWKKPDVFMLGSKNGIICNMTKISGIYTWGDGCGQMPVLTASAMSKGLIGLAKKNLELVGLARIGTFRIKNEYHRGSSLNELSQHSNGKLFMLSAGRNGIVIEKYNHGAINELKYKVM